MWPSEWRRAAASHIEALAARNRIKINWRKGRVRNVNEAHLATRQVFIVRPTSFIRYISALHELGHIIDPVAVRHSRNTNISPVDRNQIIEEAAAWAWAITNVHPQFWELRTRKDIAEVAAMWGSYLGRTTR